MGHFMEYLTMQNFGIPRHTETIKTYMTFKEHFWEFRIICSVLWDCYYHAHLQER